MKSLMIAAALALATFTPSGAQPPPPPLDDPEGNIVEELVVQAREPGPPWWRVSDGDTTVYILGIADVQAPAGLAWNRSALDRRMKGANSLIFGTRVALTGGLRDIPALLRARNSLKSKRPLEETLSEPLRVRFVAARERVGQPARRYAGWSPMWAGTLLLEDSRPKAPTADIVQPILRAAKKQKIPVVDPARYDAVPLLRTMLGSLTPAVHEQCLDGAIRDAAVPPSRARAAAEGWARGDVAAALTEPRSFEKCLLLMGGGAELWRRARDDRATAIVKALETPGHSVALIGLRQLLAQDGIIETLQARGLTVKGPGEA